MRGELWCEHNKNIAGVYSKCGACNPSPQPEKKSKFCHKKCSKKCNIALIYNDGNLLVDYSNMSQPEECACKGFYPNPSETGIKHSVRYCGREEHLASLCDIGCTKCKPVEIYQQPEEWESRIRNGRDEETGIYHIDGAEYNVDESKLVSFIKTEIRKAGERKTQEILNALLKEARKTDYADRTEYDVAYDFIKNLEALKK